MTFKKGDRLDARNWRLISLLNVDFKIAACAIAGWLLKVIHLVVAKDQTCGVPDRYIGENVAFLRDVSHATTLSLFWFLPRFLTCPFVLSGLGVVLPRHVCL